jgi:hypothetical protein
MSRDSELIKQHYGIDIDNDPRGIEKLIDILGEDDGVDGESKDDTTRTEDTE